MLVGLERWSDAAEAVRVAQTHDPANANLANILPTLESLAKTGEAERWKDQRASQLAWHLQSVGASGALAALSTKIDLRPAEKKKIVAKRLLEWLGPDAAARVNDLDGGNIYVNLNGLKPDTLEPLRGLPINELLAGAVTAEEGRIASLEPLRGMKLQRLDAYNCPVTDLSPLQGMPLQVLSIFRTKVSDLSPLRGMRLESFNGFDIPATDYSVLRGMPLRIARFGGTFSDLSVLADAPLEELAILRGSPVSDLSVLRGKPLRRVEISTKTVTDISPLRGAPITELVMIWTPVKDLSPIMGMPKLERLCVRYLDDDGLEPFGVLRQHPSLKFISWKTLVPQYRPIAEFWKEYDAKKSAERK